MKEKERKRREKDEAFNVFFIFLFVFYRKSIIYYLKLVKKVCQNLWYSSYLQFFRGSNFWILIFSIRTFFNVSTLNLQFFIMYINFPAYIYCLVVSIIKLSHL